VAVQFVAESTLKLLLAVPVYGADLRILFIGNSLTYSNDLPSMVRRIGELDGRRIETAMVAAPKPISIIVPWAAGGATDQVTRVAAAELEEALGAKIVKMEAVEHDELLAWTSHSPHAVSTALALALSEAGIVHRQLGRGGRDVTRLAASSPDVWTSILLDNAAAVEASLVAVERQVKGFRSLLSARDRDGIRARLSKARDWSGPGSGG